MISIVVNTDADRLASVVINTGPGFYPALSKALILGLGDRRKREKTEVYYIHVPIPSHCY